MRLGQPDGEEQRRREAAVGQVVDLVQALARASRRRRRARLTQSRQERVGVGEEGLAGSPTRRRSTGCRRGRRGATPSTTATVMPQTGSTASAPAPGAAPPRRGLGAPARAAGGGTATISARIESATSCGRAGADVEARRRVDAGRPLVGHGRSSSRPARRRLACGKRPDRRRALPRRNAARRTRPRPRAVGGDDDGGRTVDGIVGRVAAGRSPRRAEPPRPAPTRRGAMGRVAVHDHDAARGSPARGRSRASRPDRHGLCTVTMPGLGAAGAPRRGAASGAIRSRTGSPVERVRAPAAARSPRRTRRPTKPSMRPVGEHERRRRPALADVGRSARTTVAITKGTRRARRSSARTRTSLPGTHAGSRRVIRCAERHSMARSVLNGLPCMARQTWAGVSGMSAWRTPMASRTAFTIAGRRADRRRLADALARRADGGARA